MLVDELTRFSNPVMVALVSPTGSAARRYVVGVKDDEQRRLVRSTSAAAVLFAAPTITGGPVRTGPLRRRAAG